jgi:phage repressor protein C with HTH and peptisase S24 domain
MAIQSFQLDPNAQSYTDDEIVAKVNAATAKVDADQLQDGSTNKCFTGTQETKLAGIEDSATADQTGDEMVSAINSGSSAISRESALSQDDLNIVKTAPTTGEYKVKNIHRDSSGKLDVEYDDTAV